MSTSLSSGHGRSRIARALAPLALCTTIASPALADEARGDGGHSIGLWGDPTYSTLQATTGVPNLIADMNARRLDFSVHDGDLQQRSGSLRDENVCYQAPGFFEALKAAAMFTPGDNDWTDCDRGSHGDSHYFRVDKPFLDAQGRRLENFTRIETFGNSAANGHNDVQWIRVQVEPTSREVFAYAPMMVPAKRTAVEAPR